MALSGSLTTKISMAYSKALDHATVSYGPTDSYAESFASGTGNDQVDLMFDDQRTLGASGSEDLDLAGGLTDAFGLTLTFVKVKAIQIRAAAGNTNNVVVGGASANAFVGPFGAATHTIAIPPSGVLTLCAPKAGWTVTPSTGDLLRIANSGAGSGVTYDITILGTSA
jgi:hypothetical protein